MDASDTVLPEQLPTRATSTTKRKSRINPERPLAHYPRKSRLRYYIAMCFLDVYQPRQWYMAANHQTF